MASLITLDWVLAYLALGAVAGVFAGMLGIGGGVTLVPSLALMFAAQAAFPPDEVLHMALGTSMASIIFTSIASLRTHHRHGAVRWAVFRHITPGILIGTTVGTFIAGLVPVRPLAIFFAVFVCFVAVQMALNLKPKPTRELPGAGGVASVGVGIGILSSLVAIGGGSLTVPYLTWCNVKVHHAIGTSAAVGLPIAIGGTLGYIYNGWGNPALPGGSAGFVFLPALLPLVIGSMSSAPFGARLAHRLPVATLKRLFAGLLIVLAGKMLWNLLGA